MPRGSAWDDGGLEPDTPSNPDGARPQRPAGRELSDVEWQLINRLRGLPAGAHAVLVIRVATGKDGLQGYTVYPHYRPQFKEPS
jgi:hypothetical protein